MRLARYAVPAAFAALSAACALNTQQELNVGQQYASELARQLPIVHDAAIQADLDAIAARLTPFSHRPEIRYQFFLVNSSVVNAFAVPGGYVYVTRGVVERATSMDQLAGVLGHEMGHVELRHSAKQIGRAQAAQGVLGVASVLLGDRGAGGRAATTGATVFSQLVLAKYSRDQETEADHESIVFTTAARINPMGMVDFFRILRQVEGTEPDAIAEFFASHPLTEDRITDVSTRIRQNPLAMVQVQSGVTDAPEFGRLKAAVHRLPAPPQARPSGK
jgi:predicted Zn-dependent protease